MGSTSWVTDRSQAYRALVMSTVAWTVGMAAWTTNGVLVTFLVGNGVHQWDRAQMGWLLGAPVLTGAILRLPMGLLTDRYGGRIVLPLAMVVAAVPMFLLSYADTYLQFLLASLGFGLIGVVFAVGVAYVSLWFPAERQGTALGIFGAGTTGAGFTVMVAPSVLRLVTEDGADLAGWRLLPRLYALALVATAALFWVLSSTRRPSQAQTVLQRLAPLRNLRVWRFGLYFFFTFGGFVALSQWLVPYYVNVYSLPLATAGLLAAFFSLPAGVFRVFGGWASDRWGARGVLYLVFGGSIILLIALFPPRMEILSPGQGVMADQAGVVTSVTEHEIVVGQDQYMLSRSSGTSQESSRIRFGIRDEADEEGFLPLPTTHSVRVPVVKAGDAVRQGQLLARGETHIYFQANRWIFAGLTFLLGMLMGIGSSAVLKHIPSYFPTSVGVVGGLVGVIGALGGFFSPIVFGYLLQGTGVWTTCWVFLFVVAVICLVWMQLIVQRMMRARAPVLTRHIEDMSPQD